MYSSHDNNTIVHTLMVVKKICYTFIILYLDFNNSNFFVNDFIATLNLK